MVLLSEADLRDGDSEGQMTHSSLLPCAGNHSLNSKESRDSILLLKIFIPFKIFVLRKLVL